MAEITLSSLAHSYRPNPDPLIDAHFALKQINHLVWKDGGAYALLGPSGCGKTTLLNIISGLLTPSAGQILFGGRDVTKIPTAERNIAQVFQFPVVYDTMSVRENLAFPLRNRGHAAPYIAQRVQAIAAMIGLEGMLERKAQGLTADAKQKISLGRGMVREDVNAILFDEPLTVIDPLMKWELRAQLKALHREFGHTMIYVTHDQTEALTFADQVVVMRDGRVEQIGRPEELFETPATRFVGTFIGSPGMNFLNVAEVKNDHGYIASDRPFAIGPYYGRRYGPLEGQVEIGIRPEYVRLSDQDAPQALPFVLTRVEDVGRHRIVRGHVEGRTFCVLLPEGESLPSGAAFVHLQPEKINVYEGGRRLPREEEGV